MNVDTADLTGLAEQVAELAAQMAATGRKVTALTGKVTVMGNRLRRLGDQIEHATAIESILRGAGVPRRPEPRHARPRHLRMVRGGRGAGAGHP